MLVFHFHSIGCLAICINTTQTKVNQAKPNQSNKYRQRRCFKEHYNWNNAKQLHIENEKLRGESNRDESNSFRSSSSYSLTQWAYWVCQVHCMFLPVFIVNVVLFLFELKFCFVIDPSRIVVILYFLPFFGKCMRMCWWWCYSWLLSIPIFPFFLIFFFIEIHTWMDFHSLFILLHCSLFLHASMHCQVALYIFIVFCIHSLFIWNSFAFFFELFLSSSPVFRFPYQTF